MTFHHLSTADDESSSSCVLAVDVIDITLL